MVNLFNRDYFMLKIINLSIIFDRETEEKLNRELRPFGEISAKAKGHII